MTWLALIGLATATTGFEASAPDAVFDGIETYTNDGSVRLWAEIERHRDPDTTLFGPQDFNRGTEWPNDSDFAPHIADCFGTQRPDGDSFLLHVGPHASVAEGTPILLVPGAGDNASRGFSAMMFRFDNANRPVFSLTFSHPHGDVFQQAEVVANAIARIRARTGAAQVDVVSHSKGGMATAVYLSHTSDADWDRDDYESVGTTYRGDVRRAVFVATPLGGVDTMFRWPANNFAALDRRTAISPTSWDAYYPAGPLSGVDLADQDLYVDDDARDLFPGQRQLVWPQDAPLPGSMSWLGVYAWSQQDWFTTYNGGIGFVSTSPGIQAAVDDGGRLIERLEGQGVDPGVELFLLAGRNPILTNGSPLIADSSGLGGGFAETWADLVNNNLTTWSNLLGDIAGNTFADLGYTQADLEGLASGDLILGEITAESDGLVFVESATKSSALTARGAQVLDTRVANLAHLDLLYASAITGGLILDEVAADPTDNGWMAGIGDRYVAEDTLTWVQTKLADDPPGPGDTGATDTDDPRGTDTDDGMGPIDGSGDPGNLRPPDALAKCGCASSTPAPGWLAMIGLLGWRRSRIRQ